MTTSLQLHNHNVATRAEDETEVPILCETCLGPNPYVDMLKYTNNKACEVCERGFTVFRWKPGKDARYKKTVVCKTCAKAKNVCQCCLFDMQYGLPVQVRDSVLASHERIDMPSDSKGQRVLLARIEAKLEDGDGTLPQYQTTNPVLERLARNRGGAPGGSGGSGPNYNRNRAKICSHFVTGRCTRGDRCPYRHEMPTEYELQPRTSIRDRYLGNKDAVAERILKRAAEEGSGGGAAGSKTKGNAGPMKPPEDPTITTLFVGGIPDHATENDIRDAFIPFGLLSKLKVLPAQACAFVTYQRRASAEEAALHLPGVLKIGGIPCRLAWGKRAKDKHPQESPESSTSNKPSQGGSSGESLFPSLPPPPGMGTVSYPSMSSQYIAPSSVPAAGSQSSTPATATYATIPSKPPGM